MDAINKPFAWSYSKLKNYESCPRRYHEEDVIKKWKKEESEALDWGHSFHAAMAARLSKKKVPLPVTMQRYEPQAQRIERSLMADGVPVLTELKLSFDNQFRPTSYFDKATWFRGIADVLVVNDDVAGVYDWKTGRRFDDFVQLALMAQCVFANYPQVNAIGAEFVWIGEPTESYNEMFFRDKMAPIWNEIFPRLKMLLQAHQTNHFPEKPGNFCASWCSVLDCRHNGRGR